MDTKRENGCVPIGSILNKVLKECRNGSDDELTRVWALWDGVVGETISENARPAAFKGKILLVHVTSSPWIHQLQFHKKDIIRNLNDSMGKPLIEEIKFKIGPICPPGEQRTEDR